MATSNSAFRRLNSGFNRLFQADQLSLGLVVPIECYDRSAVPELKDHIARVKLAESLGFGAVWLRDVPFNVPSFGDAGQTFDPLVYLGYLAASTETITLAVGSLILPLRHPAHVAKAAASVDQLSGGRVILGIASGDRPEEYPAMNVPFEARGARFREAVHYIRAMADDVPNHSSEWGNVSRIDLLPKPFNGQIPLLVTGGSRQHPDWVAQHSDGWITYPRGISQQREVVRDYRTRAARFGDFQKPVSQSLYIDLAPDPNAPPAPIHLGFRSGVNFLVGYLNELRDIGVNHVALNLRFNQADIPATLHQLAEEVLPRFMVHQTS